MNDANVHSTINQYFTLNYRFSTANHRRVRLPMSAAIHLIISNKIWREAQVNIISRTNRSVGSVSYAILQKTVDDGFAACLFDPKTNQQSIEYSTVPRSKKGPGIPATEA